MTPWIVFDYGEVICRVQTAAARAELADLAGCDPALLDERYWPERPAYDLGLAPTNYWSRVTGRPVDTDLAERLDRHDTASWSHLDDDVLALLSRLRSGGRSLGLLSNAPHAMADAIDAAAWSQVLHRRTFSCRYGLTKPDPAIYRRLLADLGAEPAEVTFVDDRAQNVRAAAALGITAIHFTSAADLAARLTH